MLIRENRYCSALESHGWEIRRNGWPDFLATKGEQKIVIEIKETGRVSDNQLRRLQWFAQLGIEAFLIFKHSAFRISPDGEQIPIDAEALFGLPVERLPIEFPRGLFVESGRRGGLANKYQARGGKARARKLSAKRRSEIAKLGGLARALKVA